MEGFAPGLRESVLALTVTLRVAVFFLCVAGLMVQIHAARADLESIVRPLLRAIVVVALLAALPTWFEFTEKSFLSIANVIEPGYTDHPMRAATLLRQTVQENSASTFSLRRVGESLYRAYLWAMTKLIVLLGSVLQLPFLLLQYVLKLLCYLFLPIALGLFMVPSLGSLGVRYVQQTLAVLAWPVGFAVTELVAYHLITGYITNVAIGYGLTPGQLDPASLASVLGGILGSLWLLLGTIGTPFLMQMLFCSGAPVTAGGQTALQQLYTMQQVLWMVKSVKTGGAAVPLMAAQVPAKAGGTGGGGDKGSMPPPPPPAVLNPPPMPSPSKADPAGDQRASSALALAQLPKPQTTI
jgi:hypothetical protein